MCQAHLIMKEKSIVGAKSFDFAVRIVKMYQWLTGNHRIEALAKQVLRSGTSIGANIEEALGGYSKRDFAAKIGISLKEARETRYWLRLLHAMGYLEQTLFESICNDCEGLIKMLGAIKLTTQQNIAKELKSLKSRRSHNS